MKKTICRSIILLSMFSLVLTGCQKDVVQESPLEENNQADRQAIAEKEISETKALMAAYEKEFSFLRTSTGGANNREAQANIVDVASTVPVFKSFLAAIAKTGLTSTLSSADADLTVLVPLDAAFARLPAPYNTARNINNITDRKQIDTLKNILLYHVLTPERKKPEFDEGRSSAETMKPQKFVGDNIVYGSNNYGITTVNGNALVVVSDIDASNGVIHVIDDVLQPPTQTIAAIATANPNLSILVAALAKTRLTTLLARNGNLTVFAPTDAAFSRLPAPFNTAESISAITNTAQIKELTNILKYHVTDSRYFSYDLGFTGTIETLAASPNNTLTGILGLNSASIKGNKNRSFAVARPINLFARNGVVHVINQVLLP